MKTGLQIIARNKVINTCNKKIHKKDICIKTSIQRHNINTQF